MCSVGFAKVERASSAARTFRRQRILRAIVSCEYRPLDDRLAQRREVAVKLGVQPLLVSCRANCRNRSFEHCAARNYQKIVGVDRVQQASLDHAILVQAGAPRNFHSKPCSQGDSHLSASIRCAETDPGVQYRYAQKQLSW